MVRIPILKWQEIQFWDDELSPVIYFVPTTAFLAFLQEHGRLNLPIRITGTGMYDGCVWGNADRVQDRACQGSAPMVRPLYCMYLKRPFDRFPPRGRLGEFELPSIDAQNRFVFSLARPPPEAPVGASATIPPTPPEAPVGASATIPPTPPEAPVGASATIPPTPSEAPVGAGESVPPTPTAAPHTREDYAAASPDQHADRSDATVFWIVNAVLLLLFFIAIGVAVRESKK